MNPVTPRQLMQHLFAELARGNSRPLVDAMADDITWTIPGHSAWSRTWRGKRAVLDDLLRPLSARFADTYTSQAQRFIAEGDRVVVECRGRVTTRAGQPYHNTYCWVCRLADGKLREITEYMDTEHAVQVLGPP